MCSSGKLPSPYPTPGFTPIPIPSSLHNDLLCLMNVIFVFSKLAGKVIYVTGGSRGIGLTMALKAARDGAKIVVAAKTADPHPKVSFFSIL